jgi:hypothetical protein
MLERVEDISYDYRDKPESFDQISGFSLFPSI